MIIVGWQDMVAKIIPVDKRGRFFGITNFIGNGSGILGALAVTFVLEKFTFPLGYVFSFTAAADPDFHLLGLPQPDARAGSSQQQTTDLATGPICAPCRN